MVLLTHLPQLQLMQQELQHQHQQLQLPQPQQACHLALQVLLEQDLAAAQQLNGRHQLAMAGHL
jgi:hypothetical protein